jgi:hypothetical protein
MQERKRKIKRGQLFMEKYIYYGRLSNMLLRKT